MFIKIIIKYKIKHMYTFTYLQEPLLEMFKTVPPIDELISWERFLAFRLTGIGTL